MSLVCIIVFLKKKELCWAGLARCATEAETKLKIRGTNHSQISKKMYQFRIIKHLLDRASLDIDFDFVCRLTLMYMLDSTSFHQRST